MCGRVQKRDGRVGLGYLLNHHGMIKAEATVANIQPVIAAQIAFGMGRLLPANIMIWIG